jgi:hypothetical protein
LRWNKNSPQIYTDHADQEEMNNLVNIRAIYNEFLEPLERASSTAAESAAGKSPATTAAPT